MVKKKKRERLCTYAPYECVCVCDTPEGVSVGAVVLLDEDCCSTTLLELLLLVETPETALDQDGCQGHPLIKCIL